MSAAAVVLPPLELSLRIEAVLEEMRQAGCPAGSVAALAMQLESLRRQWQALWLQHAATSEGWPSFRALLERLGAELRRLSPQLRARDGTPIAQLLQQTVVATALDPARADDPRLQLPFASRRLQAAPAFVAPVFVIAAPRAGATQLFEALAHCSPALWTTGGASQHLFEGVSVDGRQPLTPAARTWHSDRLDADDADAAVVQALQLRLAHALRDRDGIPWTPATPEVRMLDSGAKHALRIGFLAAAFPDAHFVYLVRDPQANASRILEAWRSGAFVSYEKLPDWKGGRWSLPLVPGWRQLEGRGLAEVAVAQYCAAHEAILADLAALPRARWSAVRHESLLVESDMVLQQLAATLGIALDRAAPALPGGEDACDRNAAVLAPHRPALEAIAARVEAFVALPPSPAAAPATAHAGAAEPAAAPPPAAAPAATLAPAAGAGSGAPPSMPTSPPDPRIAQQARALASVHTRSFVQVLATAGVSLAVSTYQAGKLVIVRADGDKVNTNFREMRKPMGIAHDGRRLAIGTASEIQTFYNVPAAAARLPPPGRVDAAWFPRSIHVTGNIDIHEMAYADDGVLWSVNTRFGCLCTTEDSSSFVPRWMPPFLSALAPEDRCHLNGLALRDGRVRYVTMLGRSDSPGGWREHKADGGVLMDLDGDRVVCEGLSMPHSPRWYRERLWVLESGNGGLCRVDPETGEKHTIVELPGFTRGLDFYGPLAFVGLSQVRESATFARLPLTERLSERTCGVWVVNIEQGEVVAFLRFEQAVQEIFAVSVLASARYPELVLPGDAAMTDAFVLPDAALAQVPAALREQA